MTGVQTCALPIFPLSHRPTATITTTITTQPPSPPSSETKEKSDQPTHTQINLINPDLHASTPKSTPINPDLHTSTPPHLPRSTRSTQTHSHHHGLPTSLPSIINSNPHCHHQEHATRHASISPQHRSRHSADLATLVACYERERERCERGREN